VPDLASSVNQVSEAIRPTGQSASASPD
jgi:hypothetical protein